MKKYIYIFITLVLLGCSTGSFLVHAPPKDIAEVKADPVTQVKNAIDQAYAVHSAVTTTLLQNYHDGIITRDQKNAYAVQTRKALNDLEAADTFIGTGDISNAQTRLKLANDVFTLIQSELSKLAKKESK